MKTKIREILEKYSVFQFEGYDPDWFIWNKDFDKLEKDLQDYMKDEIEEEVSGQWEYEISKEN